MAAALGLALFLVLSGSSCILSQESPQTVDERTGEAPEEIGGFSSSLFVFTTVVADDGEGVGGGWQEAITTLNFKAISYTTGPKSWQCRIRVELPIRSQFNGIILPEYASQISAAKATDASSIVMHSKPEWLLPELFCRAFAEQMKRGLNVYEPAAKVIKI